MRLSPRLLNDQRYLSLPDNAKALLIGRMLWRRAAGKQTPPDGTLTLARGTGVDPHYGDQADGAIRQLEQGRVCIEPYSGVRAREQVPQAAPLGQCQSAGPARRRPLSKMRF